MMLKFYGVDGMSKSLQPLFGRGIIAHLSSRIIFGGGDADESEEESGTLSQILAQRSG